jgi:hypothetical protein
LPSPSSAFWSPAHDVIMKSAQPPSKRKIELGCHQCLPHPTPMGNNPSYPRTCRQEDSELHCLPDDECSMHALRAARRNPCVRCEALQPHAYKRARQPAVTNGACHVSFTIRQEETVQRIQEKTALMGTHYSGQKYRGRIKVKCTCCLPACASCP